MKLLKDFIVLQWKLWKWHFFPGLVAGFILIAIVLILTYINNRPPKPPPAPRTVGRTPPGVGSFQKATSSHTVTLSEQSFRATAS